MSRAYPLVSRSRATLVTRARLALLGLFSLVAAACGGDDASTSFDFEYRSEPNASIADFELAVDSIAIDDVGFVTDLEVVLDIRHGFVFDLDIALEHVDTGNVLRLISRPRSGNDDLDIVLSDGAPRDVQDDVVPGFEDAQAYPEQRYRPLEPLEFAYGEPLAGEWRLRVFDARSGETGVLRRWGMNVAVSAERPAPAIAIAPPRAFPTVLAQGFREVGQVQIRRVAGLEGPIDVELKAAAGVAGDAAVLAADEDRAVLVFGAAPDASLGARELTFRFSAGAAERELTVDAAVVGVDGQNVELLAQLSLPELGAPFSGGNDVWGWTDAGTGDEYALMGTSSGTAFVRVTTPESPVLVGFLPTHTDSSLWRDIKVYADHAFVVSEADGHGVQVFDLGALRGRDAPMTFQASAHFGGIGSSHNIVIDEESGFAYVVGAADEDDAPDPCFGGLFALDLRDPLQPEAAGCFSGGVPAGKSPGPDYPSAVYVHDAQCVVYRGPDEDYQGRELCFTADNSEQDGVSRNFLGIADMTDKADPAQVARIGYEGSAYPHQGWLTEDQAYFLLNDEADEFDGLPGTRTYVFDVRDLEAPTLAGVFDNPREAIGHNLYVVGDWMYQANYDSGLRIVNIAGIDELQLEEIAYFDTHPEDDEVADGLGFSGAWSVYPFFSSGTLLVSDTVRGLFVLRATVP